MRDVKRKMFSFFIAIIIIAFCGCQSDKAPTEYTDANENYSITLPANWIQDTSVSNGDMLVLYSNNQRDIIVSIQRFDRDVAEDTMGLNSLERFQQYCKINSIIATLYTQGKTEQQKYDMKNMKNVIAEELVSDSNDNTVSKAFCAIAETEGSYYICIITGEQKVYDKNINSIKEAISDLVEK